MYKDDGIRAYGNTVYFKCLCTGYFFIVAHLDWYSVDVGDTVKAREVFASIGDTGYGSGAHLHSGMFPKDSKLKDLRGSNAIDPMDYYLEYGFPCNTEITNLFGSNHYNNNKDNDLTKHEGIDFSSWKKRAI